jgi:hypothetical protein
MTFSIIIKYCTEHNDSVFLDLDAERRYAEYRYAECRSALPKKLHASQITISAP